MTTRWDVERAIPGSGLPAAARLVLYDLLRRTANGSTEIPARFAPSLTGLAIATGQNRRTVIRHLDVLAEGGWLDIGRDLGAARAEHRPNRYRVHVPDHARASESLTLASVTESLGLVSQSHEASVTESPNQTKTNQTGSLSRGERELRAALDAHGATEREAHAVITEAKTRANKSPSTYMRTIARNDGGWDMLTEVRAGLNGRRPAIEGGPPRSTPAPVPWCGKCDERTRLIDLFGGVTRCPACHPLRGTPPGPEGTP